MTQSTPLSIPPLSGLAKKDDVQKTLILGLVGIGTHIKRKRSGCIRVDAVNRGTVLSGLTVVTYLLFRDSKEKIFSTRSD